jgi:predicted nucleic acid-binding protein
MGGPKIAVLDTTVVSNFASTDSIHVLFDAFEKVNVPTAVISELERGADEGYDFLSEAESKFDPSKHVTSGGEAHLRHGSKERWTIIDRELDDGEAEALTVAILNGHILVTDDSDARRLAEEYDAAYTGSLGVLARAIEQEQIDVETADRWLRTWSEEYGYRSPVESIYDVL